MGKILVATLARAACLTWGLERGVLKLTRDASFNRFVRYWEAIVASGLFEPLWISLETKIIYVSLRRIAVVRPAARIGILRIVAGALPGRNFYIILPCLRVLRGLRASHGSAREVVAGLSQTNAQLPTGLSHAQKHHCRERNNLARDSWESSTSTFGSLDRATSCRESRCARAVYVRTECMKHMLNSWI